MAQFTNQATLSYDNVVINSNVAVGEITEVLTVTKTALSDTYTRGDNVTYIISVVNSGTASINGLTLTDNLGAYVSGNQTVYPLTYLEGSLNYFSNGTQQVTPAVTAGPFLTISNITVPAGGNVLIVYEITVNEFAPLGTDGTITNMVTASGAALPTPASALYTINAAEAPDLTITKSINPIPVSEMGRLTYTFVIQNHGNIAATAADDVVLRDLFDPLLSNLAVTFNGEIWTESANYTYDMSTGLFVTVPGQITVPAATYTVNENGSYTVTPGVSVLTISGDL